MKFEARIGDLFEIPLDEDRCVVGQVIDEYKSTLLVVVFDGILLRERASSDQFCSAAPVLMTSTFDALLHNGAWPIIGHKSATVSRVRRPEFLIGPADNCAVEDFHGRTLRRADAHDLEHLTYRTVVSPIRIQKAARSLHGIGEWNESFDILRVPRE